MKKFLLLAALFSSFYFIPVAHAEIKVIVCPMFADLGERGPCMDPMDFELRYLDALKNDTKIALNVFLGEGWKILTIEPFRGYTETAHRITLQKTETQEVTKAKPPKNDSDVRDDIETLKKDNDTLKIENRKLKEEIEQIKKQLAKKRK